MNTIRTTGSSQCTTCVHYANSMAILCAVNPIHKKGEVCPAHEEDTSFPKGLGPELAKNCYWDGAEA